MSRSFIIGGGISGLVFKYYHPEFTVITPETGGLFASAHIAIIHDTLETRRFLKDLGYKGIDNFAKKSYIGYYSNGWIQDNPTPEMKLLTIQKKMSLWNQPVNKNFRPESFDISTSTSVNYFKTFNIEPRDVINSLKNSIDMSKVIQGKVVHIDDDNLTVEASDGTQETLEYDSLVSTIGAPIFWKLYGQPKEFPSTPVTNIITSERPRLFNDYYDSVYYDDSVPYSRITHLTDKYAYEVTGVMTKEDFIRLVDDVEDMQLFTIPFGRISSVSDNEPPNKKITFLGRFAQWKYSLVLEHTVKRALEYNITQS